MRISSSDIRMESARSYHSHMESKTSMVVMVGTDGLLFESKKEGNPGNNILVGEEAKQKYKEEKTFEEEKNAFQEKLNEMSSYSGVNRLNYITSRRDALSTIRDKCIQYLMKIFFGEMKEWDWCKAVTATSDNGITSMVTETLYYQKETYYEESEETSFSTGGTVQTADGREIRFRLNVEMSRSFSAYYKENYQHIQARMCDPLVINLEGNAAELADPTFFFDIDADGEREEISMLGKGSGYLALDKNGDGVINDGSELFGVKSGDGFADLAAYDSDGNGWIDEADDIWEKLLIWTKDENGKDVCYKLSEKGIGAVCITNAVTDFSLNGAGNVVNGRIRKTGIFLYENGWAGTVQHVDVAAHGQSEGHFEAVR